MTAICLQIYVSGRVQGVFYRREASQQAKSLNITGWAKNLEDGRVEVMICGEEENIKKMEQWLKMGPRNAEVTDIQIEKLSFQSFSGFEVK